MTTTGIIGIAASIVTLAMIAVAIGNGDKTAMVFTSIGDAFAKSIDAATAPARR